MAASLSPASAQEVASPPATDAGGNEPAPPVSQPKSPPSLERSLFKNLAMDQRQIWTSPLRLRWHDCYVLCPAAGIAVALFQKDNDLERDFQVRPSRTKTSNSFSNYGLAAITGAAGGLYLLGTVRHNDHMRESGFLAGEAMADSFAVGTVMKYAFGRERPDTGSGTGEFFKGGNSFPSDHAILAWSAASVIAHEYPGVLTQIATYGLAGAISASRVTARKHFPSDVVIAS